jgi:hypothetical protein
VPVKVVIDNNIWISALIAPAGSAAELVGSWRDGTFRIVVSDPLIAELYEVLTRPVFLTKYRFTERDVENLTSSIAENAEWVALRGSINWCRDVDDNMIIETAMRGKAQYLITGDKDIKNDLRVTSRLEEHGVKVISLSKFLECINKS